MAKSRKRNEGSRTAGGTATIATPERDRVAERAYELYLARGGGDGMAMEDWLSAERELLTGVKTPSRPADRTDE